MTAFIFLAGAIANYEFLTEYDSANTVTICADGGYQHAQNLGITPDYIVGDMDSVVNLPNDSQIQIIKHPTDKAYTDGQLAIKLAAEIGCIELLIFGALNRGESPRFDHILGNISLLKLAQSLGISAKIVEPDCEIILIKNSAQIERKNFKYISFLPTTSTVKGLTLTGVKFPLHNARITQSDFITMSNEFTAEFATVTVKRGELLAISTL